MSSKLSFGPISGPFLMVETLSIKISVVSEEIIVIVDFLNCVVLGDVCTVVIVAVVGDEVIVNVEEDVKDCCDRVCVDNGLVGRAGDVTGDVEEGCIVADVGKDFGKDVGGGCGVNERTRTVVSSVVVCNPVGILLVTVVLSSSVVVDAMPMPSEDTSSVCAVTEDVDKDELARVKAIDTISVASDA